MRLIIYGVGAVGGTVAAALFASGQEVIGIARGAQLAAIQARGLTLRAPGGVVQAAIPCVAAPEDIAFRPDDMILLTMKTQDTGAALAALRANGVQNQPIFCLQNGIANEPLALRMFPNIHGVTVMMPSTFLDPGTVVTHVAPRYGVFDIGRFPQGQDGDDQRLAEALNAANIAGYPNDNVMRSKRGKLLLNLANILEAALGHGADRGDYPARAQAEAIAVFAAAGLDWVDVGGKDPRRSALMRITDVPGVKRRGTSTTQSLLRGTGSLETDFLNGEIAQLGRMHGVPVPVNAYLTALGAYLLRSGAVPGDYSIAALEAGEVAFVQGADWQAALKL